MAKSLVTSASLWCREHCREHYGHCAEVVRRLLRNGETRARVLATAWLHHEPNLLAIAEKYGPDLASLVRLVQDPQGGLDHGTQSILFADIAADPDQYPEGAAQRLMLSMPGGNRALAAEAAQELLVPRGRAISRHYVDSRESP